MFYAFSTGGCPDPPESLMNMAGMLYLFYLFFQLADVQYVGEHWSSSGPNLTGRCLLFYRFGRQDNMRRFPASGTRVKSG